MIIQERDVRLFEMMHKYRFVRLDHIRRVVFHVSDEVTRARLRKLEKAGYIASRMFKTVYGAPNIYYLRERAYNHLSVPYQRRPLPRPHFLAHSLDLVTIQIRIEDWFADHEAVSLVWFYNESKMHRVGGKPVRSIHHRYRAPGGREIVVTPDAAFALEQKGKGTRLLVFVENDRGTESHGQLKKKFRAYGDYAKRPQLFKQKFNVTIDPFLVLFVTTSEKRIANIGQRHGDHPVYDRFRFASMSGLVNADDPATPIWTRGEGEKVGLLK